MSWRGKEVHVCRKRRKRSYAGERREKEREDGKSKGGRKTKRAENKDGDDKAGIGQRVGYELEVGCEEEKMEEMR